MGENSYDCSFVAANLCQKDYCTEFWPENTVPKCPMEDKGKGGGGLDLVMWGFRGNIGR